MIVYVNAEPLTLRFETGTNLTGGTVTIEGIKPDRTPFAWTASVEDAKNGICTYETQPGDLNQSGVWRFQVVHRPAGATNGLPGEVATLIIEKRLNP